MNQRRRLVVYAAAVFAAGFLAGGLARPFSIARAHARTSARVFELRTYTTNEGKLPNLNARFRDHTMRIFDKHGMTNVGYWTPVDAPAFQNTLIYIIAHADREAATKSWQAFRDDPEWQRVSEASQVNGRIVSKVESVFMEATDYSPLK